MNLTSKLPKLEGVEFPEGFADALREILDQALAEADKESPAEDFLRLVACSAYAILRSPERQRPRLRRECLSGKADSGGRGGAGAANGAARIRRSRA